MFLSPTFAKKTLHDSLLHHPADKFLQYDTLLKDPAIIQEDIPRFLSADSLTSFTQGMPIHNISEIETIIPPIGNWFTFVLLGLIIYLLLARFLYSFNIGASFRGIGKIQSLDTVGFEKETQLTGFALSPLAIFVYAFYLYFVINPQYLQFQFDHLFLLFSIAILLLFLVKSFIEKMISIVFNTPITFKQYFSDHLYVLGISSLVQVPLLAFYIYSGIDYFLWISLAVIAVLWAFRLLRGLIIGIKQTTFSKSYIILYLCSLEILPLLIAIKMVIG